MTLPKEKQQFKHRPATVVYQRMTPQLMLAYRIFSPGLANEEGLDQLNKQMNRIINDVYVDHEVVVENGKKMRKGVGILEDIKRQMKVTGKQINEAYDAYKAEIERMIEEDRAHLAAKARGEVAEGNNQSAGKKRKSSNSSSSSTSAKRVQLQTPSSPLEAPSTKSRSPSDVGTDGAADDDDDNNKNNNEDKQVDAEDEDEFENELYEVPADRWMTKAQALAKLSNGLRRVEAIHSTLDIIHDFYKTQMVPRHEITETFQSAFSYMTRLRAHVQEIAEVVEGHDGEVRERGEIHIWEDDRTAVTVLVPQLIPKADEIPLRVAAMEGLMEEVSAIADELAKAAVEPTRKRFRAKLAELVKQAHTPVPPPYWEKSGRRRIRGEGTRAPGAKSRSRNMNPTKKPQESSLGEGRNKRAKAMEVIIIDDD